MGKEVVYCFQCKTRLLSDQFEQKKAVQLLNRSVCIKCAKEMLASLPAEEQERVRKAIEPDALATPAAAVVDPAARPKTPLPASMGPLQIKPPTSRQLKTRRVGGRPSSSSPAVAVVGAALLVAVILALVLNSGSGGPPDRKPPSQPSPSAGSGPRPASTGGNPSAPSVPSSEAVPPRRDPTPRGPDPTREAAAREALEEAVRFAREAPGDLRGIVKKFRSARWISEGTSVHESVVKAGEPFERQMGAILDTCEREVEATVRGLLDQKRYRDVFTYLQNELSSFDEPDWTGRIRSRIDKLRSDLKGQLHILGERAMAYAREGKPAEARAVLNPMRDLGLAFIDEEIARLDSQIETLAKSRPDPDPEPVAPVPVTPEPRAPSEADRRALQEAIAEAGRLASSRNYSRSEEILAEVGRRLQGTPLAAEANRFREVVQRAGMVFQAICQALAREGAKNELEISYYEKGRARTGKGRIVHMDDSVLHLREPKMGRDARVVPLELLEAEFLMISARTYLGNGEGVRRDLACFLALEGQFERAKIEFAREAADLPDSVRSLRKALSTGKTSKLSDSPAWKEREREAEALYEKARKAQKANPGAATDDFKRLLNEFRDTNFVDARLKEIEEIVNRGREYLIDADGFKDMTGGWKRTAIGAKGVRVAAVMDKDVDPTRGSPDWIEIEFFALAGKSYRIFFHVGGCCETSSSLRLQGDDLNVPVAPGNLQSLPIGDPVWLIIAGLAGAGSHGAHSVPPTHWGWIPFVTITYPTGGVKRLRIASQAKGAALSHVLISSEKYLHSMPPTPNELGNGQ